VPTVIVDVLAADDAAGRSCPRSRRSAPPERGVEGDRPSSEERPAKIAAAAALKDELAAREPELAAAEARLRDLVLHVPNPADESVPEGGEADSEVVRTVGEPPAAPPPLDHAAFGEAMGWVDSERGAATSGSRFAYLQREAVMLEFALVQWVLGRLTTEGFVPVVPPVLVRENVMEEAGFFPTDRQQVYELPDDGLCLVGTAEVPLSALHRGEILPADSLPRRYVGFSTASDARPALRQGSVGSSAYIRKVRCSRRDPDAS